MTAKESNPFSFNIYLYSPCPPTTFVQWIFHAYPGIYHLDSEIRTSIHAYPEGRKKDAVLYGTYDELSLSRICSAKNHTRVKARNRNRAAGYNVPTALNSFRWTRSLDHTAPDHWTFCEMMLRTLLISCLKVVTSKRELKLQVHSKSCGASNSHLLMTCNLKQNYTFGPRATGQVLHLPLDMVLLVSWRHEGILLAQIGQENVSYHMSP